MIVQLIILQLIALLLGNYMFKSENIVAKKSSNNRRTPVFHALLIALLSYLLSFDLGFWKAAIFIAFTHLGIDLLKSYSTLTTQYKIRKSTVFFINLLVKLFIFLIAVIVYNHFYNISFYLNLPETKYLATLLAFIFCMKPANTIILHLFSAFNIKTPSETSDTEENKSLENAGKLIGVAERMITLILILNLQYEAVGLVIAAKSILRFNSTAKSEYVLMGTLLSFGFAIFWGVIVNLL